MNNKYLRILSIIGVFSVVSGCTSYSNYSYAVEGHPTIVTPTQFPATDDDNYESFNYQSEYTTYDVTNTVKFYNSVWFSTKSSSLNTNDSGFKLVSGYNIKYLKNNPNAKVMINGYASELGTKKGNQRLSLNRALSAKKYLVYNGISSSQIKVKAYGNFVLVFPETNNDNNPSNRRIDFTYIGNNAPSEYSIDNGSPVITVIKTKVNLEQNTSND